MVQVLPYIPSFGENLVGSLGNAVGKIGSAAVKRHYQNKAMEELEKINPRHGSNTPMAAVNEAIDENNKSIDENSAPSRPPPFSQSAKISKLAGQAFDKQGAKDYFSTYLKTEELAAKDISDARKEKAAKESATFAKNEPELIDMGKNLQQLDLENTRLSRLDKLSEDSSKFPGKFAAPLLLTEEGLPRAYATAFLTPEAQEFTKIVIDGLSGAQQTFGGKVSNFEAATYMKGKASLLNSPEGRKSIINDLKAINQFNKKYVEGVLNIVDEKGGAGKISLSSAERLWQKKHSEEIDALKERFINPNKDIFKSLPPAKQYKGRKLENENTGETFESDGKEWIPIKG